MTNEVGIITGQLELRTTCGPGGVLELIVRYAEAAEWYSLKGTGSRLHDRCDHPVVHELLVDVFSRPT